MPLPQKSAMSPELAEYAAIDFESSGFGDGGQDAPIQLGIAVMRGGEISPEDHFRTYIQPSPPRPISNAARAVHRISDADLDGAPDLMALWPEIRSRLRGRIVVAHGAGTEKRFLRAFPLHGFNRWVDTLGLARQMFPDLPNHSLGELIRKLGQEETLTEICPDLTWHDALFDAAASLVLLRELLNRGRFSEIAEVLST